MANSHGNLMAPRKRIYDMAASVSDVRYDGLDRHLADGDGDEWDELHGTSDMGSGTCF